MISKFQNSYLTQNSNYNKNKSKMYLLISLNLLETYVKLYEIKDNNKKLMIENNILLRMEIEFVELNLVWLFFKIHINKIYANNMLANYYRIKKLVLKKNKI